MGAGPQLETEIFKNKFEFFNPFCPVFLAFCFATHPQSVGNPHHHYPPVHTALFSLSL
jgi:hypothetical protein